MGRLAHPVAPGRSFVLRSGPSGPAIGARINGVTHFLIDCPLEFEKCLIAVRYRARGLWGCAAVARNAASFVTLS